MRWRALRRTAVAGLACVALTGAGWAQPGARQAAPDTTRPADPPDFILALESHQVELRAPATGRLVKVVGDWAYRITNGGLIESANGRYLYATELTKTGLAIYRYTTATDQRVRIAAGNAPSLSPDGRFLAYGTGVQGNVLAIRDLATGHTRDLNLARLLGSDFDLLNGGSTIVWLGNDHDLAVVPVADAIATGTASASARGCESVGKHQCLIAVDIANQAPVSAARIERIPPEAVRVSAGPAPGTILVDVLTRGGDVLDRIDVSGTAARTTGSTGLGPNTLAVAVDPAGRRVVFLKGHGPVALWIGTISHGKLVDAHRLLRNVQIDDAGW